MQEWKRDLRQELLVLRISCTKLSIVIQPTCEQPPILAADHDERVVCPTADNPHVGCSAQGSACVHVWMNVVRRKSIRRGSIASCCIRGVGVVNSESSQSSQHIHPHPVCTSRMYISYVHPVLRCEEKIPYLNTAPLGGLRLTVNAEIRIDISKSRIVSART